MATLRARLERDGYLLGVSARDPSYSILLTRNCTGESAWRVTSFRDRQPVGHRAYDMLEGGGPTRDALQEFLSDDVRLTPARSPVRACTPSVPAVS